MKNNFKDNLYIDDLNKSIDKNTTFSYFETIDSTNDYLKNNYFKFKENHIVIANEQTKGRGKNSKKFFSPAGNGVYFSFLFKHNCSFDESSKITIITAIAIAKAIKKITSFQVELKWINDILANNLKIGGILCENILSDDNKSIVYTVIGIGLNVEANLFPDEIKDIATSIENCTNKKLNRAILIETIRYYFYKIWNDKDFDYLEYYRKHSATIGKDISVFENNEYYNAKAIDIDKYGRLIITNGKAKKILYSAEISIKH